MERTRLRCARCNRSAIYLARASGEPLCLRCFEKSLVKSVRRSLGRFAKPSPGASIVIVEPLVTKPWLCSSLKILVRAVRSHRNRLVLVGYGDSGVKCPLYRYMDRIVMLDRRKILEVCEHHSDLYDRVSCLYRAEHLLGSMIAKRLGIDIVFLMRPRDVCSLIGMIGIVAMNLSLAVESLPLRITYLGTQVIDPLYGVGSQDLAAYAYFLDLIDENISCGLATSLEDLPGYNDIQSLYMRSSEMIYSSSEAIIEIFKGMTRPRCPLCGSPTEGSGYCHICSSLLPLLEKLLNAAG